MSGPGHGADRWIDSATPRGARYDERFERLAAGGHDVHGEAALVASLGVRSVLDAGCGTGRVAIELARRGLDVVGTDIDPVMLEAARRKAPELSWVQGDLSDVELGRRFDAVLLAGNVMIFLVPGREGAVLANVARHLTPGGVAVAGFSLGAGLTLGDYDRRAAAAGLVPVARWATWDRASYQDGGAYAVSVHSLGHRPGSATRTI